MQPTLLRALALWDFAIAAVCVVGVVVAIIIGSGGALTGFAIAAVFWLVAGVAMRRLARRT